MNNNSPDNFAGCAKCRAPGYVIQSIVSNTFRLTSHREDACQNGFLTTIARTVINVQFRFFIHASLSGDQIAGDFNILNAKFHRYNIQENTTSAEQRMPS
jgi:hypothetical protein